MSDLKQKIIQYFSENRASLREELLHLLAEMVAEKTVNVESEKLPSFPYLTHRGEEFRVAQIVERELKKWEIPYQTFARQLERPNIIARVGSGKVQKKLFIAAHMDIVPAGDGWDTDPFNMTIIGDHVHGRGVLDNKGPLVSSLLALRAMKNVVGADNIAGYMEVAALSDEEATDPDGIDYGIGYLLEENLISPTYAIIPDIGENMRKIDIAEKGRLVVQVTAIGKQAHGSTPDRGINAINMMARFLTLLENHTLNHRQDPVLGHATVNVGEIRGGAAANIVPGECKVDIDIRIVPGQTPDGVVEEFRLLTEKAHGIFRVELKDASLPHAIDPNNELVKSIQENSSAYFGFTPEPYGLGGGTFAKGLNLRGIKAVGFGPGDDTAFHVANEFVSIEQLLDFSCLLCLVSLDLV